MDEGSPNIKATVDDADPQIKLYISEREKENARLQTQIAKYEVKQLSLEHKNKALEKEMKNISHNEMLTINTTFAGFDPKLPREQLEALLIKTAAELGYRIERISP